MFELLDISKYFGEIKAVDSVSLKIKEGEMLGLVGPNGSGKSTLLKIMLGIIKPLSGKVLFNGEELTEKDWKAIRKRIGYMPERVNFYDNLTGRETLNLFARVKSCSLNNIYDIVKKIVFKDALDRRVGGYSKGMRQRLNLAQALLNEPDILILDEPTSGLDPMGTKEFYDILDAVRDRKKLTVILSSHILAEIEEKIDRVAVIKNGSIKAIGGLEELYTGLKLPLKISIAINERDMVLEELLNEWGALNISYKDGYLHASVPMENKLKMLSAIMAKRDGFVDISLREPNLEEVFFGIH
ncbi:MAG: ABC transporter ATP-binding protein [Nitrospirota bacterium]